MLSYLWLRWCRRPWSWILNAFYRKHTRPLPEVDTIQSIQKALQQIIWIPDSHGDWIQSSQLTWGLKTGDCEDMARIAQALLKQIGIRGYLLSVIIKPPEYSHAVCVYSTNNTISYFTNGIGVDTVFTNLEDAVKIVANNRIIDCWSLEDDEGHIITIKRGK